MDGLLTHVTVGKSGVWGVTSGNAIFFRQGVASDTSYGTVWQHLIGSLKQIDAGSSGVVYGVNRYLFLISIWLRTRIRV
ncbi:lectin L6-like [Paramuricea clavata]|uniref:Lectin L6-like n=1 Tax=Paramuricea clavata TaxID=317549 RepID=A0A6S7KTB3_PARCT|nr:lectin L6-like [Paramuricea clavata]